MTKMNPFVAGTGTVLRHPKHKSKPVTKKNVVREVKGLKKAFNKERKKPQTYYVDTNQFTPTAVANTGTVFPLLANLVTASGASTPGISGFLGNKVTGKTLMLRYALQSDTAAGVSTNFVRVMLVQDKMGAANSAAFNSVPTVADILTNAAQYLSWNNRNSSTRYKILANKFHALSVGSSQTAIEEIFVRWGKMVQINQLTNSVELNNLYLLVISDNATLADEPLFAYNFRINYHQRV